MLEPDAQDGFPDALARRIREKWEGQPGRRLERIDDGRPASYLEHNARLGRERLRARILEWLAPLAGLRVLDAGCGTGLLAERLAAAGARVSGVDLVPRWIERARERAGGVSWVAGNLLDELARAGDGAFDAVVLSEVLEDYGYKEQASLLEPLLAAGVPRVLLAFRTADRGRGLERLLWSWSAPAGIDPISLLRWIHTATPYRQARGEVVSLRSYRVQLSELVLEP